MYGLPYNCMSGKCTDALIVNTQGKEFKANSICFKIIYVSNEVFPMTNILMQRIISKKNL